MKKWIVSLISLVIWPYCSIAIAVYVDINDGGSHTINNTLYQIDNIRLDFNIVNDPGTQVTIAKGAIITGLHVFNNASVTLTGGTVNDRLYALDNATVTMTGGSVNDLQASGDATVTMTGGTVDMLVANTNSIVTVSGGFVTDSLAAAHDGMLLLEGSNFWVTDLV